MSYSVFAPDAPTNRAVYLIGANEDAPETWRILAEPKPYLISVEVADWNRDLSPWRAERVFKGGETFAGNADAFLDALVRETIPKAEKEIGSKITYCAIAGVSLAGLFAVYAAYRADCFDAVASVSGSLWFDGFIDYMRSHEPQSTLQKAYFSLGDRESATKNPALSTVGERTELAATEMKSRGAEVLFETNPGNHFVDGAPRMKKAIDWICGSRREG